MSAQRTLPSLAHESKDKVTHRALPPPAACQTDMLSCSEIVIAADHLHIMIARTIMEDPPTRRIVEYTGQPLGSIRRAPVI